MGGVSLRPASAPQACCACGRERWSPCGLCLRGRSPSSLGRRGTGFGRPGGFLQAQLGAGQALLLESVFICIYFEQLPTWLSSGAGQLLEKHQGLGISSRNHLVPTDLTLHPLPVPARPRTGSGLAGGARRAGAAFGPAPVGGFDIQTLSCCHPSPGQPGLSSPAGAIPVPSVPGVASEAGLAAGPWSAQPQPPPPLLLRFFFESSGFQSSSGLASPLEAAGTAPNPA